MMDHNSEFDFLSTTAVLFGAIFVRYVILAGLFYYVIHIRFADQFKAHKISLKPGKNGQIRKEIMYSLISSFLFAILGTVVLYSWQHGATSLYISWKEHAWYWMVFSIVLFLFIHETYYYWLHRWMHLPKVFKWIHRAHHESLTPTAWTSFSFHPIESVLQALPIVLMIYLVPIHIVSLLILLLIMTVTSVINHLNSELYPAGTPHHWFGKWWIGATHHTLHHIQFRYNFGLYFTFWDRWMNSESPDYLNLFKEKTKIE